MPEETHPTDRPLEHPQVRREPTDASFRAILYLALGTIVLAAVIHFAILEFFFNRCGVEDRAKASPFPLASAPSTALPAEPRLEQVDRLAGIEKPNVYLRQESREEQLESYGPTKEQGFVHVPIERAMQHLVEEKQLPSRASGPTDRPWRAEGLVDGGEPNSGRDFRGETAMKALFGISLALAFALATSPVWGQPAVPLPLRNVGFDQRVNEQVPLELPFRDEAGREVRLGEYFKGKPVILVLAYYRCPMLCTEVLNGLTRAMLDMSLSAGTDYQVVTVSFDPTEKPELAAAKKKTYLERYGRPGGAEGWHFLTGDEGSIRQLTEAVGFRYTYDAASNQFAHASGIMVLTPSGKLFRYFLNITFPSRDLQLSLVEASNNHVGSVVDQAILYCFHYDPSVGKYGVTIMNIIRVAGVLTVLAIGGLVLALSRLGRRKPSSVVVAKE